MKKPPAPRATRRNSTPCSRASTPWIPKLKHGDARLRDWLLLELGLASPNDPAYVARCRKAIKNASIKRELGGA